MIVILLCVSLCLSIAFVVQLRRKESIAHKLPPAYPGAMPIIGHTHQLVSNTENLWNLIKNVAKFTSNAGGVIYMQFGTQINYLITDPEDALTVSNLCLKKHSLYDFAKKWLRNGLITGSGEVHKRHRKLLNPLFNITMIHNFLAVFNMQARKLVREMEPHIDKGPHNPMDLIKRIQLEISCITTFGFDTKIMEFINKYMKTVDELMFILIQRFQKWYLHSDIINTLFGTQFRENHLIKTITQMSYEVIQEKKLALKNGTVHGKSAEIQFTPLLDILMQMSLDGTMTDAEIQEEIDTNIVASFDTVTYTFTNIILFLGTYPEIQERLYKESIQVVGTEKDVEKEDLQKLVYTRAVIKETLRVIPTVPVTGRAVVKDVKLKNYTLRAGSQCLIFNNGITHNAAWGDDVEQFRPERWLDESSVPQSACYFTGFSIGKRACIGMGFAMTTLSVSLVHFARQYQWTADISKVKLKLDITLKPIQGHKISVKRRTR